MRQQDPGDLLYIRGDQGRAQIHVRRPRRRAIKPVVVVKSGRMAQGAKAAATHGISMVRMPSTMPRPVRRASRGSASPRIVSTAPRVGRLDSPPEATGHLCQWRRIRVLAIDRLVELGQPVVISPISGEPLAASLLPPHGLAQIPSISPAMPMPRAMRCIAALLDDPGNDAIPDQRMCRPRSPRLRTLPRHRDHPRLPLAPPRPGQAGVAAWVGADQKISDLFNGAGIPNYPTEDDVSRASCTWGATGRWWRRWPRPARNVPPICARYAPRGKLFSAAIDEAATGSIPSRSRPARGLRDFDGADLCR